MRQKKTQLHQPPSYRKIIAFTIPIVLLLFILGIGWISRPSQQFSELAQAFLHGQLNFLATIGGLGQDPILYHNKIYWGEGPFPAVLLMPFVAIFNVFHLFFYQNYLQWLLIIGVLYFIFMLARRLKYSKEDSFFLAFAFVLGSVFIGAAVIPSGWLFAQVLTTFLLLWSLYEYYTRKRWWLIGIICGLILLTRATAAPIFLFFILEFWQEFKATTIKRIEFIQLCLPLCVAAVLIGTYNFLRFHNPFNGGYEYQLLDASAAKSRALGVFSLIHVPANLFSAMLRAPITVLRNNSSWTLKFPFVQNNPYGLSIFITSPYFLYLITRKFSPATHVERHLIVAILVSCLLVFSYYGIGANQFGYRYSLDFLPELFLLFMIMYHAKNRSLSKAMKIVIVCSGICNYCLLWTYIQVPLWRF